MMTYASVSGGFLLHFILAVTANWSSMEKVRALSPPLRFGVAIAMPALSGESA